MLQFLWIVDFCEFHAVVKFTKIDSYFALLWNSLKSTVEYIFTHIRYQIIRYFLLNCGLYEAFGELWLYRDCEITFHLPKCWGRQQCLESRKSNRMVRGCVLQIRHDAGGKPIIPKPWLAPSTMTSAILICKVKKAVTAHLKCKQLLPVGRCAVKESGYYSENHYWSGMCAVQAIAGNNLFYRNRLSVPVFSYKLRYIAGFWLVEMAISTNQKPTIYRNLYKNTGPVKQPWLRSYNSDFSIPKTATPTNCSVASAPKCVANFH